MSKSLLDRLMFAQGNRCVFCERPLTRSEASVEHLVASANGGNKAEGNCVACCKSLNVLLGSMSLKEKLRVVLNQRGPFRCPVRGEPAEADLPEAADPGGPGPDAAEAHLRAAIANLAAHKTNKPRTEAALRNAMKNLLPKLSAPEQDALIESLKSSGTVVEADRKLTYGL